MDLDEEFQADLLALQGAVDDYGNPTRPIVQIYAAGVDFAPPIDFAPPVSQRPLRRGTPSLPARIQHAPAVERAPLVCSTPAASRPAIERALPSPSVAHATVQRQLPSPAPSSSQTQSLPPVQHAPPVSSTPASAAAPAVIASVSPFPAPAALPQLIQRAPSGEIEFEPFLSRAPSPLVPDESLGKVDSIRRAPSLQRRRSRVHGSSSPPPKRARRENPEANDEALDAFPPQMTHFLDDLGPNDEGAHVDEGPKALFLSGGGDEDGDNASEDEVDQPQLPGPREIRDLDADDDYASEEEVDEPQLPIPREIRKFLNLDAEDSGSGDEEEPTKDDQAFIDDAGDDPMGSLIASPSRAAFADDQGADPWLNKDPERIAAWLKARYRQAEENRTDKEADLVKIALLPTDEDPPLLRFLFRTARSAQAFLMSFVPKKKGAGEPDWITFRENFFPELLHFPSVFITPQDPTSVYVELAPGPKSTKKFDWIKWALQGFEGRLQKQELIPIAHQPALLHIGIGGIIPDTLEHSVFARVTRGPYKGNLAVVTVTDEILVVPRIMPPQADDPQAKQSDEGDAQQEQRKKPRIPQKLFYFRDFPANKIVKRNKYHLYEDNWILCGLLVLGSLDSQPSRGLINVENVNAEEWEVEFFRKAHELHAHHSDCSMLLDAPVPKTASATMMAVMDGDRVMVVDGEHAGKAGYAVIVRTLDLNEEKRKKAKPKDRDKFPPQYLRVAGILESYTVDAHGITRVPSPTAVTRRKEDISFFLYDRVYIAKYAPLAPHTIPDRSTGRVANIDAAAGMVEVAPSIEGADRHWYPIKVLTLCFNLGDWVAVYQGPYKGRAGFIVALRDGAANIYDAQAVRDNAFVIPTYDLLFMRPEQLHLANNNDTSLEKMAIEDPQLVASIHTGGFWKNTPVLIRGFEKEEKTANRVVRKQMHKGRHGMIKGGTLRGFSGHKPDIAAARQQGRELKEVWRGATMHVQLDGTLTVVPVPIENLLDLRCIFCRSGRMNLPVIEAVWIPQGVDIHYRPPTPEPDPAEVQGTWVPTAQDPVELPRDRRRRQMAAAERDGSWMSDERLVGKRLDVVADFSSGAPLSTTARTMKKAGGAVGYVVLKKVLQRDKLTSTFLQPQLEGGADGLFLSPCNLKPLRTMQKGNRYRTESIMAHMVRVVIISEDWHGDTAHIGEYAEIIPPKDPKDQDPFEVKVRFPRSDQRYKYCIETYPLTSLCRARNESIPGEDSVEVTSFA
ncbi:hypothetical protein FB451DRAFT_1184870 [Mycena latifolia]|nr:hypothetical protein FB451DRAFT_1184870 [Mycena latifolia]